MSNTGTGEVFSSGSSTELTEYWMDWFLAAKGNEYFCEIDLEYTTDRFNLTGLSNETEHLALAIDLITDNLTDEYADEVKEQMEATARFVYGLIHARFIITARGLQKMLEKYRHGDFGYCPRVHCNLQPLLPVGLHDQPRISSVKLYCAKCEDLYNPKSARHQAIDGAFFGTSFPAMFFQVYKHLIPTHPVDRFVPKIFGFKMHDYANLARWQEKKRRQLEKKLNNVYHMNTKNTPGGYITEASDKSSSEKVNSNGSSASQAGTSRKESGR